ncbi:MAG: hypothetical protein GX595_06380, partial [Lentisphaerae bacterium]|nr:hypothetical protein [Lentisphaerota bacterium]
MDITDLVRPGGTNLLGFHRPAGSSPAALVIRRVRWRQVAGAASSRRSSYALSGGPVSSQVAVDDRGGLVVTAGGREYRLRSTWSWPGAGLNALGAASESARWAVRVEPSGPAAWTVEATDPAYVLRREVHNEAGRVRVRDLLTNRTDRPLGIIVRQDLDLAGEPVPVVYLGGNPDPTVTAVSPRGNTTLFVPLGDFGLGLALEDDASRCQARLTVSPDALSAGWENRHLALAPGESYALEWSLYPCGHGDYWAFINRVRRDWGVNDITVQGPYAFLQPTRYAAAAPEDLRGHLQAGRQRGIITGGGWHYDDAPMPRLLAFGTGIFSEPFEEYRRLLRAAIGTFREAAPEVPVMVYVHCFYNGPQTEAEKERLRDSWATDREGAQQEHAWGERYQPSPMVVPTLSNRFGPEFLKACEALLDDYGAGGLYLDESNGGHVDYTWNAWDGRSAQIDPATYQIEALVGHPVLMSVPVRQALAALIAARGKAFIANGTPYVMAENHGRYPRFVEAQHLASRASETHLYTPLIWDYGVVEDCRRLRRALAWGTLPVRLNLAQSAGPLARCFPLTVQEVHPGWILARERLVISDSGRYGWPGETVPARLYVWQEDLIEQPVRDLVVDGAVAIEVPARGLAILERR